MAGPSVARYGLGVVCLLLMALAFVVTAQRLRRCWLPGLAGAAAGLAETVIGLALLVAEMELLGAVGWFRLAPLVLGAAVIAAAVHRWVPAAPAGPGGAKAPARPRREWLIALVAATAVLAEWLGPTLQSYSVGIHSFDSVWYHLPWAASFAQTGWITPLRFFDVDYLTGFYPATAELVHGLGIVLLGRDTLSPGLNLVWLGLVLLAAYCLGRSRGLGAATLLGAAVACATPMMRGSQAGTAANDAAAVFFLVAACALIPSEAGEDPSLALGAVAAGLAIATKLTAAFGVLALSLGVIWLTRGRRRRAGAIWFGALIVAGGYWYVRDLIAVGNPFPFIHIPGLPVPAPTAEASTNFSIAHYLGDGHLLTKVFAPALHAGLGLAWPVLLVATILGPLLCLAPGADRRTRVLGVVALVATVGYVVTPMSAAGPSGDPVGFAFNLRYSAPALTLSLAVLPLAPVWSGARGRILALGALSVLLILTLARPGSWKGPHLVAAIALALALALLALAVVTLRVRPGRRPALGAVAVALIAAIVIGGYFGQRHYLRGRYAYQPHVSHLAEVWAFFRGVHDARVGLAGSYGDFFQYPVDGLDDSNRVTVIAAHGAHGSFTPIERCAAWRQAVDAGHFQFVLITPNRSPWSPRLRPSPEYAWIAGASGATPVLAYRAQRQPIVLYRLHGPLRPQSCRAG